MGKSTAKGQVLIEVLAAIVIASVALMTITHSLMGGYRVAMADHEQTRALFILHDHFQQVLLSQFSSQLIVDEDCGEPSGKFTCKGQVTTSPAFDESTIDEVSLSVAWASGVKQKVLAVSTWLAQGGAGDKTLLP